MSNIKILKNEYYDSVTLMSLTAKLERELENVELLVAMATSMNIELLKNMDASFEVEDLTSNDLIIAANNCDDFENVIEKIFEELNSKKKTKSNKTDKIYTSISQATADNEYNLGVVSLPGEYAYPEVIKLLDNDINVMLFSDNITVEEEIELKDYAISKNLLMMGPDCGTSIINNKGICFANQVSKGDIGIVSASGTGLQEVSVVIDKLGGGISQAIGVGGRDLSLEVSGRMMLHAINLLEADSETKTIVLVSKPPVEEVKNKILNRVNTLTKKCVIYFIDQVNSSDNENIMFASNLYDTAYKAVNFEDVASEINLDIDENLKFAQSQKYIRGLFCGGTLCLEALSFARKAGLEVYSNVAKKNEEKLANPTSSRAHSLIDLGDDFFTNGKPHPMIEPSIRLSRIIQEAQDVETKVILMDFELGYGSHEDPVGITIDYIKKAKEIAKNDNREIAFVAYVLGTDKDFQNLSNQEKMLRDNGVIIAKSNVEAISKAIKYVGGKI